MKAILVREFGGPGVAEFEEVPAPLPAAGPVLLRIHVDGGRTAVWLCPMTNSLVTLTSKGQQMDGTNGLRETMRVTAQGKGYGRERPRPGALFI